MKEERAEMTPTIACRFIPPFIPLAELMATLGFYIGWLGLLDFKPVALDAWYHSVNTLTSR
jgi:hypothetical protein